MKSLLVAGKTLLPILPKGTRERLSGTCFRGTHVRKAGNFVRWANFDAMLKDETFVELFRDVLEAAIDENLDRLSAGFTEPWTLPFTKPVGWTSSLPRTMVNGVRLVPKRINPRSTAMFVAPNDLAHPAPQTSLIAMTLSIRENFKRESDLIALIHTMYPGPNIGTLRGDLTKEKGFVLFDFHHPGSDEFVELDP